MSREHEQIQDFPVDLIDLDGNVRSERNAQDQAGLEQSIEQNGLLVPVRLRRVGERYVPTDGSGRVLAYKNAGKTHIPAIVERDDLSDIEAIVTALVANCQRSDIADLDKAIALNRLTEAAGWSGKDAAKRLGFSETTVSRLQTLAKAPEWVKDLARSGVAPLTAVNDLVKIVDPAEQAAIKEQIVSGATRDAIVGFAKRSRRPATGSKQKKSSRVRIELSGDRSVMLAGAGLDDLDTMIQWLEELLSKARKLRPKGVALGTFVRILKDEAKA